MFQLHSIAGRVAIGKSLGFIIGGLAFFWLPTLDILYELQFRLGLWLFYMLLGVMIALSGTLTVHPLGFPLTWWMRGAIMGIIFHLVLVLVAYDAALALVQHPSTFWLPFTSPYWLLLDGALIGVIIGYTATKLAGEGVLPMR